MMTIQSKVLGLIVCLATAAGSFTGTPAQAQAPTDLCDEAYIGYMKSTISELNGLTDCLLCIILIDIIINNPQAPLDIGDQIPIRLNKVVTEQACYPPYIIPGALEDN